MTFVHIPKNSGTSWGLTLAAIVAGLRNRTPSVKAEYLRNTPRHLKILGRRKEVERSFICPAPGRITFWIEEVCGEGLDQMRVCGLPESTFLRDPIARVISHYQYYVDAAKAGYTIIEGYPGPGPEDMAKRISKLTCREVPSICNKPDWLLHNEKCKLWRKDCGVWFNHQVQVLAGSQPTWASTERRYKAAVKYFDKLAFYGITDYYRHSVCLFLDQWYSGATQLFDACCRGELTAACHLVDRYNAEGAFGANTTKHSDAPPVVPDYQEAYLSVKDTARALYEANRFDCLLYDRALRLFRRRALELEERRGVYLGPVWVPEGGVDFCTEKMAKWLT